MIIIENITVSQYQNINKDISNTKHSLYEGEGGGLLLKRLSVEWLNFSLMYNENKFPP
jgi:hypothetical protein